MSSGTGRHGRHIRARVVHRRLSRSHRLWRVITGGLVAYAAAFAIWAVAPIEIDPESRAFIGDLAFLLPGLLVAGLAWRAAGDPGLSHQSRRAWTWLAVAYLAYWLGDAVYFMYDVALGAIPNPSPADAAYLAYYPLLLVGLASFPRVLATGTQRLRFMLDATTVALGGAMVVWYFVLGPIAETANPQIAELLISMAYPVGDLVLLLGVALTVTRVPRELSRPALGLLVAGLLLSFVADLAYGVQNLDNTYESGRWVDALYIVAWAFLGASAYRAYARRTAAVAPDRRPATGDQVPLVPYLAVALGYGMLVAALRTDWSPTVAGLVVGAGGLTALVVARQVVAVRENVRLVAERETRRGEARFRSLVQNASDLIVVVDSDWAIQYETPSVERVLGYRLEDLQQAGLAELVHPDDRPILDALRDQPASSTGPAQTELRIARSDGSWLFVEASVTDLLDDPEIRGLVVTIRNVDDRKRLELKLTHQAYHDPLTGLANRLLFNEELAAALAQGRDGRGPVGLLFLDVTTSSGSTTGSATKWATGS
jgi:PAS domain S-box-containing protein